MGTSGKLTNDIKRHLHQVILLDEIEKVRPSIWNVLLPSFEEENLDQCCNVFESVEQKIDFNK